MKSKEILHLQPGDLEELAQRVAELLQQKFSQLGDEWINEQECMSLVGISSKTTLLRLRQEGRIRYSQPYKRVIMYDKNSILNLIIQV